MKTAIVYCVDSSESCINQMMHSIKTVRTFLDPFDIYLLTNAEPSCFDRKDIKKIIDVSPLIERFNLKEAVSYARKRPASPVQLVRMAIPVIEELRGYDKVLYLDSDVELWKYWASDLLDSDSEDHELTAVVDAVQYRRVHYLLDTAKDYCEKNPNGYDVRWEALFKRKEYVNSGILVFNMKRFADAASYEKRLDFIFKCYKDIRPYFIDQNMINVFYDIHAINDPRYNSLSNREYCEDTIIRHNTKGIRIKSPFYPPLSDYRPIEKIYACNSEKLGIFKTVADRAVLVPDTDFVRKMDDLKDIVQSSYGISSLLKLDAERCTKLIGTFQKENQIVSADRKEFLRIAFAYMSFKAAFESGSEKTLFIPPTFMDIHLDSSLKTYIERLPKDYDCALIGNYAFDDNQPWRLLTRTEIDLHERIDVYLLSRMAVFNFIRKIEREAEWTENNAFFTFSDFFRNMFLPKGRIYALNRNWRPT